jgi:hypothetical protein
MHEYQHRQRQSDLLSFRGGFPWTSYKGFLACILFLLGVCMGCSDAVNKKAGGSTLDASRIDVLERDLSWADGSVEPQKDVGHAGDAGAVVRDLAADTVSIDRGTYPSGPYGTEEGSVIEDLRFSADSDAAVSFGDLRQNPSNKLLLVVTAAGWSTACIEAQPFLESLHKNHGSEGLVVLIAVFEDANYNPVTPEYAADWKAEYGLSCIVVADSMYQLGSYYNRDLPPLAMLVDLQTMEIRKSRSGIDRSGLEADIRSHL